MSIPTRDEMIRAALRGARPYSRGFVDQWVRILRGHYPEAEAALRARAFNGERRAWLATVLDLQDRLDAALRALGAPDPDEPPVAPV